jgi:hypothetical protein
MSSKSMPKDRASMGTGALTIELTTPSDLPDLAECELFTLSGAFTNENTNASGRHVLPRLLFPFREPLVRAGIPPRRWPDYESTIRRRAADMRNGAVFFTARWSDSSSSSSDEGSESVSAKGDGTGRPVGMIRVTLPKSEMEARRRGRKLKERVLNDVVHPVVEGVRSRVWGGANGEDGRMREALKEAQREVLTRHPYAEECYIL